MFLGHLALGFAGKRAHPAPSLGIYLAAAELPDLLWGSFLLLGWERVAVAPGDTAVTPLRFEYYPVSHSLLADLGWAAAAAGLYWWWRRDRRGAHVVAWLVVSHWVLDVVSHRADVPLAPGGARLGLGLWRWPAATVAVEGALLAAGVLLYRRATPGRSRGQRAGLAGLLATLAALYLTGLLGPPPPGPRSIALANLALVLLLLWAAWIDRRPGASPPEGRWPPGPARRGSPACRPTGRAP